MSRQFRAAIQGRSQAEAASEIGVTRQALNQYLNRKTTPQGDILARACAKWGIATLKYRGVDVKASAFRAIETKPQPDALQLDLLREPIRLENNDVVVTLRRSRRETLQVTIQMKKAGLRPSKRTAKTGT